VCCDTNTLYFAGSVVSSGLFNHFQAEDQISVDLSQLEAPNDAVVMDYLTNENIVVVNGTAYLDEQSLCSGNISTAVRDAINSLIPIEPVCGKCGMVIKHLYFSIIKLMHE
jgi:hypothetical protein